MLNVKRQESRIILKSLGARKRKGLHTITKIVKGYYVCMRVIGLLYIGTIYHMFKVVI